MTRRVCQGARELSCAMDWPIDSCPYGRIGDSLWVRETWYSRPDNKEILGYKADGVYPNKAYNVKPSIFMPRKFSRIDLRIIDINVERLQDITWQDAKKEGSNHSLAGILPATYKECFKDLWDSINDKRGYSWESNPWVWVIEFKKEVNK
jgi:hypothetical protein